MFEKGKIYKRDAIHQQIGGSTMSFILYKKGVVGLCPNPKMNPDAPKKILVGSGSVIKRQANEFAKQGHAVPVFLKRDSGKWEYKGNFSVESVVKDPSQFSQHKLNGRTDVSSILILQEVP
jgi:hypothetical protein